MFFFVVDVCWNLSILGTDVVSPLLVNAVFFLFYDPMHGRYRSSLNP